MTHLSRLCVLVCAESGVGHLMSQLRASLQQALPPLELVRMGDHGLQQLQCTHHTAVAHQELALAALLMSINCRRQTTSLHAPSYVCLGISCHSNVFEVQLSHKHKQPLLLNLCACANIPHDAMYKALGVGRDTACSPAPPAL